jgi:hypothetical protein
MAGSYMYILYVALIGMHKMHGNPCHVHVTNLFACAPLSFHSLLTLGIVPKLVLNVTDFACYIGNY